MEAAPAALVEAAREKVGHRVSKATPERIERILDALRLGNTRTASAARGPVAWGTFKWWMQVSEDFRARVEEAEAEAERRALLVVMKAAIGGDWKAAAWWLERRRPDEYSRVDRFDRLLMMREAEDLQRQMASEGIEVPLEEIVRDYEHKLHESKRRALPASGSGTGQWGRIPQGKGGGNDAG